jgi:CARDB
MNRKRLFLECVLLSCLPFLIMFSYVGCVFHPGVVTSCETFADYVGGTAKDLTDSDHGQNPAVFQDGTIYVYHGFGCAESKNSKTQDIIKVEQSLPIPGYTNATIFLNGWHLKYLHGPHNVAGLGTWIYNIALERGIDRTLTLTWEAGGALSDKDFKDAYNWCYYYTILAWNDSNISLAIDHNDGACSGNPDETRDANYFFADNKGTTTALSSFPTFINNSDFTSSKTVAILPRGFGFGWGHLGKNRLIYNIEGDHQLLEIAYNMDHSETFIESGKKYQKGLGDVTRAPALPSLVPSPLQSDSGFVSWETYAIFKDDDTRRDYLFGEIVSGLGGNDAGVIQPPFSILPKEEYEGSILDIFTGTGCITSPLTAQTQDFEIKNIPYTYAIPMLTGWELNSDPCNGDERVSEIGVWIDKWSYEKIPGAPGKLRYTLSSRLSSGTEGGYRHKITVLGLKAEAVGPTPSRRAPDLVPFSPLGADPTAFCRMEPGGKLRVTIKNQGNEDAGASKTMVTFGETQVTLDTPAISAGGSVDVLFEVPAGCFRPDCSFRITVDSNYQVNEFDEGNNSAAGGCIG